MHGRSDHLEQRHSCSDSSGKAFDALVGDPCGVEGQVDEEVQQNPVLGCGDRFARVPRIASDLKQSTVVGVALQALETDYQIHLDEGDLEVVECNGDHHRPRSLGLLALSWDSEVGAIAPRLLEADQVQILRGNDQRRTVHEVHWYPVGELRLDIGTLDVGSRLQHT